MVFQFTRKLLFFASSEPRTKTKTSDSEISLFVPLPDPQTEYINSVTRSKNNPISPFLCSDQTSRNSGKLGHLVDDRTSSKAHELVVLDPKRG
jgi:hypothetical protein